MLDVSRFRSACVLLSSVPLLPEGICWLFRCRYRTWLSPRPVLLVVCCPVSAGTFIAHPEWLRCCPGYVERGICREHSRELRILIQTRDEVRTWLHLPTCHRRPESGLYRANEDSDASFGASPLPQKDWPLPPTWQVARCGTGICLSNHTVTVGTTLVTCAVVRLPAKIPSGCKGSQFSGALFGH